MADVVNRSVGDASPLGSQLARAYHGKKVLLTGHTGFKGGWLTLWLSSLGARVTGYALPPPTTPSFFDCVDVPALCEHRIGDVRDLSDLRRVVGVLRPDFVFHLAAQPLVRPSYEEPIATLETNVMGTANVLEAIRLEHVPAAVVMVTSDKCYENRERLHGYREDEAMGGHDVYSMSKGAAELVVASYRRSFFSTEGSTAPLIATARAGNVIGGGDWARDRIVPDCIRALVAGTPIQVRNPGSIRPWQHVIEPLAGYLLLGARLSGVDCPAPRAFAEAWNFGPDLDAARPVHELVEHLVRAWGAGSFVVAGQGGVHEAAILRLNIEKAALRLGWRPRWGMSEAAALTAAWYQAQHQGARCAELRELSLAQIGSYLAQA